MRRFSTYFVLTTLFLLVAAGESAAKKPSPPSAPSGYTLVANPPGTATYGPGENSATAVQLTSSGASGWSAIGFAASGLKLSDISWLSTDYEFTLGSCWEGAPRFTVGLSPGGTKEIYFYMGPPSSYTGCPFDTWTPTGNLATPNSPVDDSSLHGGSHTDTFAGAVSKYGKDNVAYIAIDLDGGFNGPQTVLLDNTQINNTLYTYDS